MEGYTLMKYAPTAEEFIEALEKSLKYCREVDDRGSVDHEMGRWQEWVLQWPPIFDPEGGI